jgi:hypothetical protein
MDRRGRTSEVINLVHFDKKRIRHVVAENFETRVAEKNVDVASGSRGEIIGAMNLVAIVKQAPAKMRPEKTRATSDQDTSLSQIQLRFACFVFDVHRFE